MVLKKLRIFLGKEKKYRKRKLLLSMILATEDNFNRPKVSSEISSNPIVNYNRKHSFLYICYVTFYRNKKRSSQSQILFLSYYQV
jgi:hypothetical protein